MRRAKPARRWCRRQARHKAPIFSWRGNRQAVLGGRPCRSARPDMATPASLKALKPGRTSGILGGVSVQLVGILLGVFSLVAGLVIFLGAFQEQSRANKDFAGRS